MTKEQFYQMIGDADTELQANGEASKTALDADRKTIFDEWGAAKPEKLENIKAYIDLMGFDIDNTDVLSASQLRAFGKAAASTSGESIQASKDKSSGVNILPPAQANELIGKIQANPAFKDKLDPLYKGLQQEYFKAIDMAAGRKPQEYYAFWH